MLRGTLLIACLALLPMTASAFEEQLREGKFWRNCSDDSDCVAIAGLCDLTGVNVASKEAAAAYYKQKKETAKCTDRFWKPKAEMVRCRLGQCETIPLQARNKK